MPFLHFVRVDQQAAYIFIALSLIAFAAPSVALLLALFRSRASHLVAMVGSLLIAIVSIAASGRAAYLLSRSRDALKHAALGPGSREGLLYEAGIEGHVVPLVAFAGLALPFVISLAALLITVFQRDLPGAQVAPKRSSGLFVSALGALFVALVSLVGTAYFAFRTPEGRRLDTAEMKMLDLLDLEKNSAPKACATFAEWTGFHLGELPSVRQEVVGADGTLHAFALRCAKLGIKDAAPELNLYLATPKFLELLPQATRDELKEKVEPKANFGGLFNDAGEPIGGIGTLGGPVLGHGSGFFGGERAQVPATAKTRQGTMTVAGRLPPEVIQRVVRRNLGRLRACYEDGLKRNPKLEGRVVAKFVIDRSGLVPTVTDGGSEIADRAVATCAFKIFKDLTYPAPESGIVTVIYPIIFSQ